MNNAQDRPPPRILTIAGSDSSGGAGIQADIKTITMLGGYAMSAITAVTAQNTCGVQGITPIDGAFVQDQIHSCLDDIGADAIKIGMLPNEDVVHHVAEALAGMEPIPVVIDPVMVATSGDTLVDQPAISSMQARLFPLATLLTPNLPELELLCGRQLRTLQLMQDGALELAQKFGCAVLAKGGHTDDARVIDLLATAAGAVELFEHIRLATTSTHGSGCTLSAAIATMLGHGVEMVRAITLARKFVFRAIQNAPGFGQGNGPMGHQAVFRGS